MSQIEDGVKGSLGVLLLGGMAATAYVVTSSEIVWFLLITYTPIQSFRGFGHFDLSLFPPLF